MNRKIYLIGNPAVRKAIRDRLKALRDRLKTALAYLGVTVILLLAVFGAFALGYLIMIYNGG